MIADKRKAYQQHKLSQTTSDFDSHVRIKSACKKEIRKKKREYEIKISHKARNNTKIFSYIRSKQKTCEIMLASSLLSDQNITVNDDKDVASVLSLSFSKVFTKEKDIVFPTPLNVLRGCDEAVLTISGEVRNNSLENNAHKPASPDEISPRILKEYGTQLANPITLLFNNSISQGRLPLA